MDQGPEIPSPTLADIGKGRVYRTRRAALLERYDGAAWVTAGRYGNPRDAGQALDREVAAGAAAGTLRVTMEPPSVGAIVLRGVIAVAIIAWLVFMYFLLIR